MNSLLRKLLLALLVVVVAVVGLWAGTAFRTAVTPVEKPAPLVPGLKPGMAFPDVAVLDEKGAPTSAHAVLGDSGGVVLLLDPECEPCRVMAVQWQDALAAGKLGRKPLVGIVESGIKRIPAFRMQHDLTFAVLADTAKAFLKQHHVEDFPLCLWVGRDFMVRHATFDPYDPTPAESLAAL